MAQPNGWYNYKGQREDVLVVTADYTVQPHLYECGNFSNRGAAGAVTVTLPEALPGREHTFHVETAQNFVVNPHGTDEIWDTAAVAFANDTVSNTVIGSSVTFECITTGFWNVRKHIGVWDN